MKLWKRNAVVAAIVLFVCAAVYLNWSYSKQGNTVSAGSQPTEGKLLGEAALVSSEGGDELLQPVAGTAKSSTSDYFSSARINRQQARDAALSLLNEAAGSPDAGQTMKDEANIAIQTMASFTLSEAQIENLVTAKGYQDCVAFIGDNSASVVVSAGGNGLTEADTARILEIVMDETGMTAAQITIIESE